MPRQFGKYSELKEKKLNEFQLQHIPTRELILLRNSANDELKHRSRIRKNQLRADFAASLAPIETNTKYEIELHNSSHLLSIPGHKTKKFPSTAKYLRALIRQDWSHLFPNGDDEQKYYVYAHVDISKAIFVTNSECGGNYGGMPFYIGKGSGGRAYDLNRNQGHGKKLKEIERKGIPRSSIVKIIIDGLTESKAYELEAKLIYFFGTIYDKQLKKQGVLYNLDIPKLPIFEGVMKEYPLKIKGDSIAV